MAARKPKTLYVFPKKGNIGIAQVSYGNSNEYPIGMVELFLGQDDFHRFDDVQEAIRKCKVVTLTHTPDLSFTPDNQLSNLVISFHAGKSRNRKFHNPELVIIQSVNAVQDFDLFRALNDRLSDEGHFGFSLRLGKTAVLLELIEIFAVAPPIEDKSVSFEGLISVFIGEPCFYAEYSPPIDDVLEGLTLAVHHFKTRSIAVYQSGAINLTGLIPEGRA